MDADEARKALDLARKHDENGNIEAALKWARKSVAIYSTPEAMALFTRLKEKGTQGTPSADSGTSSAPKETVYMAAKTETRTTDAEGTRSDYTEQQVEVVRRVKRAGGDFYAVLNVHKTATDTEVKKSYKKLALQLHPDKNRAPGADEAFKLVSKAFTVLSDKDKRSMYDKFGGDPESRFGAASSSASAHPFAQFQSTRMRPGAEMDPEDLFNMFFGGGMGGGPFGTTPVFTFGGPGMRTHYYRPGTRTRQAGQQSAQNASQTAMWFQVLPLLILLFCTMLSYLPNLFTVSDPDFRWRPTALHRAQRTTLDRGISYFVDPVAFAKHPYVTATTKATRHGGSVQRFSSDKSSSELRAFERRVEEAWMKELYRQCDSAQEYKRRRMLDAQGFFGFGVRILHSHQANKDKLEKIRSEVYESCEQLEHLFGIRLR